MQVVIVVRLWFVLFKINVDCWFILDERLRQFKIQTQKLFSEIFSSW